MSSESREILQRRARIAVVAAAAGVFAIGVAVTLGWAFQVDILKRAVPGMAAMKPNAALALMLCAVSLALLRAPEAAPLPRRAGRACAAAAAAIALAALVEHATGRDLGIDQLLFHDPERSIVSPHPGRVALETALSLLMIATAFLCLDPRPWRRWRASEPLLLVAASIAALRLAGNLFESTGLPRMSQRSPMGIHTALALIMLSAGGLLSRPDGRLMSVVMAATPSGRMTRRLILATLTVPIVFDYVRLLGEVAGLYNTAMSVAIRTVGTMIVLLVLTWIAALLLQRNEAERALVQREQRRQEAILSSVLDSMSDGVVVADPAGKFLVFNAAAERLLGVGAVCDRMEQWSSRYGVYRPGGTALVPTDELPLVRALRGESVDDVELFIKPAELVEGRYISVNARPLLGEGGGRAGGVAVFRDVTTVRRARDEIQAMNRLLEQKVEQRTHELIQSNRVLSRTNDELRRKNSELDEFTYVASHDLQEPLRKLIAFSGLLERDAAGDLTPDAAKDIKFITEAAARMQRLVQDLLTLSRAGRGAMKHERVRLDDCCDAALEALAARVAESAATITRDRLPTVLGDATLLTQLYQNLIGNALKFRAEGAPQVRITAERATGECVLGVLDNGIGVPAQYAEQIFAPFKRLHGRDAYEGTGIGLSICRRAVERHGGRIWVEPGPRGGSHFKFTLPESSDTAPASAKTEPVPVDASARTP